MENLAKQHKEVLLEVLNHAHTVKRDEKFEFYRRMSLKPIQREARSLYTWERSHYES